MSVQTLFNRAYSNALTRGHVVHSAVVGYRAMGYGPVSGDTPEEAYNSYRFAEGIVDAADAFYLAVKPHFRKTFKMNNGKRYQFIENLCPVCGHPYCGLYAIAPVVPTNRALPLRVAPAD